MWAAAGTAVGSLELLLPRSDWGPGEMLHGRLVLTLDEPIDGLRLVVGVHATEERCVVDPRGREAHETRTRYRMERRLAGFRRYVSDVYDFRLPLPDGRPGLRWRVYARLDDKLEARCDIRVE
jgi:hypothetical protein